MEKTAETVPLMNKKGGELGKYLRLGQVQKLATVSKTMNKVSAEQLSERRTETLQFIHDTNEKKYQIIKKNINTIDFFDLYDLRRHLKSKNYLNTIALVNIKNHKYTLECLLPFLHIDWIGEFGKIAYEDWKHHQDTEKTIQLLMK